MWGIELQPLSGEAPVTVPLGETVLGRGPLLGISDKRVSRNHALLENCDGRLRLKSTHVNPCFLQTSSDPVPCPLQRDTWTELRHGDTLSLLPGHLCYKVVFNKPDQDQDQDCDQDMEVDLGTKGSPEKETEERLEGTQKNSEVLDEEEEGPMDVKSPPVGLDHTQTPHTNRMNQSDEEEVGDSPNKTQSAPRRRTLPSWMMSAAQGSSSSSSTYSPKVVKRSKTPSSGSTSPVTPLKKAPPQAMSSSQKAPPPATSSSKKSPPRVTSSQKRAPPPVMSSPEGAGQSEEEEQRPRKKRKMNGSERAPETSAAAVPSPDPRRDPSPDPSPGPVPAKTTSSTKTNRMPCPYGKDCYRKNPIHFQEQSHPGDSDYDDRDQDQDQEDSDRPECPYGTDCYRKNPLHRKEFKHSKRPARKTRTAPTRRGPDDDDDEDEYDSSFIDDDSDYDPGKDRSESESEDLSLLKTEAAIFTKKRK